MSCWKLAGRGRSRFHNSHSYWNKVPPLGRGGLRPPPASCWNLVPALVVVLEPILPQKYFCCWNFFDQFFTVSFFKCGVSYIVAFSKQNKAKLQITILCVKQKNVFLDCSTKKKTFLDQEKKNFFRSRKKKNFFRTLIWQNFFFLGLVNYTFFYHLSLLYFVLSFSLFLLCLLFGQSFF